jgi:hypothetical protein
VIDRYIKESRNPISGSRAQMLNAIKNSVLGETKCSEITANTVVSFARELTKAVEPQTCGNYLSSISNVFTVARPAWSYPHLGAQFDVRSPIARIATDHRSSVDPVSCPIATPSFR